MSFALKSGLAGDFLRGPLSMLRQGLAPEKRSWEEHAHGSSMKEFFKRSA
jgi:hypothetical protein